MTHYTSPKPHYESEGGITQTLDFNVEDFFKGATNHKIMAEMCMDRCCLISGAKINWTDPFPLLDAWPWIGSPILKIRRRYESVK